jgi:DUF4097 and DUF4098 domain-containing protein YvlB
MAPSGCITPGETSLPSWRTAPFQPRLLLEGLTLESENGSLKVRLARFAKVDLNTENGAIYYETQPVEKGDFKFVTENGIVSLVLPIDFDFELTAKTESGHVKSAWKFR